MTTRNVTVAYKFDKDLVPVSEARKLVKSLPPAVGKVTDNKCNFNYPVHRKQAKVATTITPTSIPGMKIVSQEQVVKTKVPGKRGRPKGAKDKKKRKPRK